MAECMQSKQSRAASKISFLDLPYEIRRLIYLELMYSSSGHYAIIFDPESKPIIYSMEVREMAPTYFWRDICSGREDSLPEWQFQNPSGLIAFTCKQLYEECQHFFWTDNIFHFRSIEYLTMLLRSGRWTPARPHPIRKATIITHAWWEDRFPEDKKIRRDLTFTLSHSQLEFICWELVGPLKGALPDRHGLSYTFFRQDQLAMWPNRPTGVRPTPLELEDTSSSRRLFEHLPPDVKDLMDPPAFASGQYIHFGGGRIIQDFVVRHAPWTTFDDYRRIASFVLF